METLVDFLTTGKDELILESECTDGTKSAFSADWSDAAEVVVSIECVLTTGETDGISETGNGKNWDEEIWTKGKICSWKTASLEKQICLVVRSKNLYAFLPKGYPRNTQGVALGQNLSLWGLGVEI